MEPPETDRPVIRTYDAHRLQRITGPVYTARHKKESLCVLNESIEFYNSISEPGLLSNVTLNLESESFL